MSLRQTTVMSHGDHTGGTSLGSGHETVQTLQFGYHFGIGKPLLRHCFHRIRGNPLLSLVGHTSICQPGTTDSGPADADRSDLSGSGDGEYAWITILVPEGTTRVVGSTRPGDEIICLPYERMALVWWPGDYDDLAALQEETPQGSVDLMEDG